MTGPRLCFKKIANRINFAAREFQPIEHCGASSTARL